MANNTKRREMSWGFNVHADVQCWEIAVLHCAAHYGSLQCYCFDMYWRVNRECGVVESCRAMAHQLAVFEVIIQYCCGTSSNKSLKSFLQSCLIANVIGWVHSAGWWLIHLWQQHKYKFYPWLSPVDRVTYANERHSVSEDRDKESMKRRDWLYC